MSYACVSKRKTKVLSDVQYSFVCLFVCLLLLLLFSISLYSLFLSQDFNQHGPIPNAEVETYKIFHDSPDRFQVSLNGLYSLLLLILCGILFRRNFLNLRALHAPFPHRK